MARKKHKYVRTARKQYRTQALLVAMLAVVFIGLVLGIGNVAAKYIQQVSFDTAAKAKEFYFTSDYLTPEGKTYTLNPSEDGTASVSFKLRNYEGLNISEMPIRYTVSVDRSATVTYGGEPDTNGLYWISLDEREETVILSGLQAGTTYNVTATGLNGYQQILKATFKVEPAPVGVYKHTDNYGDYIVLTVWTEGNPTEVDLSVPEGLIPDATDNKLMAVKANGWKLTLGPYESVALRFFTTSTYTGTAITVEGITTDTPLN